MSEGTSPVRAALYARVSGREQVENTSLANQEERLRAYAAGLEWDVVECYVDKAESGAKESRPELDRLMADAEAGRFDKVLVLKLDRWTRDLPHLRASVKTLLRYNVALVSMTETLDFGTSMGRAMFNLIGTFAELERDTIRDRTLSGRRARAEAGAWPGGNPPFGYRVVAKPDDPRAGKVAVPDPEEAETVRRAVALLLDHDRTTGQIAAQLNAEGRFRKTGVRWTHGTLARMLRNDVLLGRYTFGRAEPVDEAARHPQRDRRRFQRVKQRVGGREIVTREEIPKGTFGAPIEITLPPILDEQTFAQVQAKLDSSALGRRDREDRFYPLSGYLWFPCSQEPVGGRAHGIWRDQGGPEGTRRMRCINNKTNAAHPQKCDCPALLEEPLAEAVWTTVVDLIADPAFLSSLAQERLARLGEETASMSLVDVEQKIDALERRMASEVVKMLDAGLDTSVLDRVRGTLQDELDALRACRDDLAANAAAQEAAEHATDRIATVAESGRERLLTMSDRQRADVYGLLGLSVRIIDFGVPHGRIDQRRAPSFELSGRLSHGLSESLLRAADGTSHLVGAAIGPG